MPEDKIEITPDDIGALPPGIIEETPKKKPGRPPKAKAVAAKPKASEPKRAISGWCFDGTTTALAASDEPNEHGYNNAYTCSHGKGFNETIHFRAGPIRDNEKPGWTDEALLAVLKDRLTNFQKGPHACYETGQALKRINEAMLSLTDRTKDRVRRGIEGTDKME